MENNSCNLCPFDCGADRITQFGRCRAGNNPVVARAAAHYYEEPCISGENGSGAVFFSGCGLGCIFCQNADISQKIKGKEMDARSLAEVFDRLADTGVHNINLVTPSHFAPKIAKALEIFGGKIPVIWNSSGYEKVETLKLLDGLVDIYMPDMKYGDNSIGLKYSNVSDYFETAKLAIDEMYRQRGRYVLKNGLLKSGVLVRHLVLPEAFENTRNVLDYISERFAKGDILFSLMGQYTPISDSLPFMELKRRLNQDEYKWAMDYMDSCRVDDGFIQELSSADKCYIPEFDMTGV